MSHRPMQVTHLAVKEFLYGSESLVKKFQRVQRKVHVPTHLLSIHTDSHLLTVIISRDSEYDWWNIEVAKDRINKTYLFSFGPYHI